jgi:flagellar biosynthesis/type III secretory pathway M-ring protein FliF/YscJ
MSCHTATGPATVCATIEKAIGRKVTSSDWHQLKRMAAATGYDTSRSYVNEAEMVNAIDDLTLALYVDHIDPKSDTYSPALAKEYVETRDHAFAAVKGSRNTQGTVAVMTLLSSAPNNNYSKVLDVAQQSAANPDLVNHVSEYAWHVENEYFGDEHLSLDGEEVSLVDSSTWVTPPF